MESRWLGVTLMGLSKCPPQNLRHVGNQPVSEMLCSIIVHLNIENDQNTTHRSLITPNLDPSKHMPILYVQAILHTEFPGKASSLSWLHDHTHTTPGRTPLDEWSVRSIELYLTHKTLTRGRHPCPLRDSNPQSHQASGRSPIPDRARILGSNAFIHYLNNECHIPRYKAYTAKCHKFMFVRFLHCARYKLHEDDNQNLYKDVT
jgi:hypothetical protein